MKLRTIVWREIFERKNQLATSFLAMGIFIVPMIARREPKHQEKLAIVLFGAVAVLAALRERDTTGRGQRVTSALYESTAYLVAQHMAQYEITGEAPPPMSVKRPAWGVYDIFETGDGDRLFVGVVTDTQWQIFCREFEVPELAEDARLQSNGARVRERGWLTELTPSDAHAGYFPDLWINAADAWSMDVEVEGRWWAHSHHWDKWRAVGRAQGFAAIVARTQAVRKRLVQGCRAAGVLGVATDLGDGTFEFEDGAAPAASTRSS